MPWTKQVFAKGRRSRNAVAPHGENTAENLQDRVWKRSWIICGISQGSWWEPSWTNTTQSAVFIYGSKKTWMWSEHFGAWCPSRAHFRKWLSFVCWQVLKYLMQTGQHQLTQLWTRAPELASVNAGLVLKLKSTETKFGSLWIINNSPRSFKMQC